MQTTAKRLQIQHIQAQGAAAFNKQTWVSQLYRVRVYTLQAIYNAAAAEFRHLLS